MEMSAGNYLNSNKLGVVINTPTLQPDVHHLMDTSSSPSIVLTLDVSASMEYQKRLQKLGTAVRKWIHSIPYGLLLGMVEFSTKEELLSEMTLVDATSRERLVRSIPTSGQGETCIGCGVRLALQVLGKRNGIMVLVTDGQNTEPGQFISNIQAEVTESGTKVVAVGFGEAAPLDDLQQLASATGGLFFYVSDHDGVQGLFGALQEALKLAKLLLEKSTGIIENSTTEFSGEATDLPVTGTTTVSSQQHTTGLRNRATSHIVSGKQHNISSSWFILGITAAMVGGVIFFIFMMLLIWLKCITPVKGFYSVIKQNRMTLYKL